MSALDTPVYHDFLQDVRPASPTSVIVDVGGGDGRNARPWLENGYRRVVVVDAVAEGLARFRTLIGNEHPEWLDHILLIEADARRMPLKAGCADTVMAIESLYYLNDDYELGLRQCKSLLAPHGRLLLSERDYEGGLLLQLLYRGVADMIEASHTRQVVDGPVGEPMISRCFTEQELIALLSANGLAVQSVQGISLFSVVLGWMRNRQLMGDEDAVHLPAVRTMLGKLGREGRMRRCHIVIAGLRN
jgi:SAM-dependent methyltransferase